MGKTNQLQQEKQEPSKMDSFFISYFDTMARGLISFFISFILLAYLLMGYFHWSFIWTLPFAFLLTFAISPLLSKVRIGHLILDKYKSWLNKRFKK
jgi:predicted PurR-regulated permease PerM